MKTNLKEVSKKFMIKINFNLIGALTGRPYPFTIRVWEHLYKNSIDCCDGFGQSVRVGVAYNQVRRLLPNFIYTQEDTPWINDRTRFAFEGLPFVNVYKSLLVKKDSNKKKLNNKLTRSVILLFYFFDHLNHHMLKISSFVMVFGTSTSVELIGLLLLTFSKYSFLKVRTSEVLTQKNDLESNFQLNSSTKNLNSLLRADFCLLIGVNTRYEGSYLNLKLRKRYLKSDFNIISLSALLDLTFPVFIIGSTVGTIGLIVEGNSLLNQTFKNASYPMLIMNSNYFKRLDSKNFINFIEIFKLYTHFSLKRWNGLNILNFSLNDVGTSTLNRYNSIKSTDLINYNIIYFFNSPLYIFSIKKFLELKTLKFLNFKNDYKTRSLKTVIYQNPVSKNNSWIDRILKKSNAVQSYFSISTKNFYNSTETYINTEGYAKKSSNVVASNSDFKNDWKFLRRIFKHTKKDIEFTKDLKDKKRIFFKSKNPTKFKNYLAFHFLPIKVYTRTLFCQLIENKSFINKANNFFFLLNKSFNSKIILWLQDFYLGNRDLYSRHSKTMVKCSLYIRSSKLNFLIGHVSFIN
jgi:hypothetical protein